MASTCHVPPLGLPSGFCLTEPGSVLWVVEVITEIPSWAQGPHGPSGLSEKLGTDATLARTFIRTWQTGVVRSLVVLCSSSWGLS